MANASKSDEPGVALDNLYQRAQENASMHAFERDRLKLGSVFYTLLLLLASLSVAVLAAGSEQFRGFFHLQGNNGDIALAVAGLAVFVFTLISELMAFASRARDHATAVQTLVDFQQECEAATSAPKSLKDDAVLLRELRTKWRLVNRTIPPLCESRSEGLRAAYLRKKEIHKIMGKCPFAWVVCVRFVHWWRDTKKVHSSRRTK